MKRTLFVTILGIFVTTGLCADTPPRGEADPPPPGPAAILGPPWKFFSATMARLNKKGEVILRFQI